MKPPLLGARVLRRTVGLSLRRHAGGRINVRHNARMKVSQRPSMAAVAKRAGITTMTVSRFFSGKTRVSEETRAHIIDAAASLGFCCASCHKIGVLPIAITVAGEMSYLCGVKCAGKFVNRIRL